MASFRKLSEKGYLNKLDRSDQEVDAEFEEQRPGRVNFSQAGPSALAMDDYKHNRFKREKEAEKRKRRQEIARSRGKNI